MEPGWAWLLTDKLAELLETSRVFDLWGPRRRWRDGGADLVYKVWEVTTPGEMPPILARWSQGMLSNLERESKGVLEWAQLMPTSTQAKWAAIVMHHRIIELEVTQ